MRITAAVTAGQGAPLELERLGLGELWDTKAGTTTKAVLRFGQEGARTRDERRRP